MPLNPRVRQPALDIMAEHHLTVAAVAFAIQEDRGIVRRMLSGISYPSVEVMEKTSEFLRRPIDELFDADKRARAYGREHEESDKVAMR